MQKVLIDNEWLEVALPHDFATIEHKELETLMGIAYEHMWGVRSTERHALMSVTWKDSNKVLTKLVSEKSFAKRVNETFAKRYRAGGYACKGFFERAIAGAGGPAQGFGFSYTVEGIAQEGEVLVFKRGIRCYTLTYYTRSETAGANRAAYNGIVASLVVR